VTAFIKDERGDEVYDAVQWQKNDMDVIPTIESQEVLHMTPQIPTTPGGVDNESGYLPHPMPSLSPSSVGESPGNSSYGMAFGFGWHHLNFFFWLIII
jgi:hypothetical protein